MEACQLELVGKTNAHGRLSIFQQEPNGNEHACDNMLVVTYFNISKNKDNIS
jgi:hypothetical protein